MPTLRDGTVVEDARFNRLKEFDERSRDFPVSHVLGVVDAPKQPITKEWACTLFLDQGREGSCVGHGWGHEAAADPIPVANVTEQYVHDQIYWGAQRIDNIPGGSYPGASPQGEGTSVIAGAKWMTQHGFYTGYHWAFSEHQAALALSYLGPVVLGVNWYDGMYNPNAQGYLRPTGQIVGGHCILAVGYNATTKTYKLHNSWGADWGQGGTALIAARDLASLLEQDGEACIPDGRRNVVLAA